MPTEHIKELLSRSFLQLIAYRHGFTSMEPEQDFGVDLTISKVGIENRNGVRRMVQLGQYVDFQLKATCEASIERDNGSIRYDLKAKNYNDLVERQQSEGTPLLLVLFVLPDEESEWLAVQTDHISLRRHGYWYEVPPNSSMTTNVATTRIEIPSSNQITLDFLPQAFSRYYP